MGDRVSSTGTVVAIDGPAGSGKSTLARRVAHELHLPYVNTGLMYRALAGRALVRRVDPDDGPGLRALLETMSFRLDRMGRPRELVIDDRKGDEEYSSSAIEETVSAVASHPEVRALMADLQRRLGASGAVMEGRDIGSVVFPSADVKIFLDATLGERAGRRLRERAGGPRVADELARRDASDSRVNPFVPAEDAVRLDTTGREADEVFREAMAIIRSRLPGGADR
jgi:cytidylate kinase